MKKIIIFVYALILTFSVILINVKKNELKADSITITPRGAQVRTEKIDGKYGIRFVFDTKNVDLADVEYFGVLVTREADPDDLTIANGLDDGNEKVIIIQGHDFLADDGDLANSFGGSIVKIPDGAGSRSFNPVEDNLTAKGVIVFNNGDEPIYSSEITSNVVDPAREEFNNNGSAGEAVADLVTDREVRIDVDGAVSYDSISNINTVIAGIDSDNTSIDLVRGNYSISDFVLEVSNFKLTGAGKNNSIKSGTRSKSIAGETSINHGIQIGLTTENLDSIEINGLTIDAEYGVEIGNRLANLSILNNDIIYSGHYGIFDSAASGTYNTVLIQGNHIYGDLSGDGIEYSAGIYVNKYARDWSIKSNYIGNANLVEYTGPKSDTDDTELTVRGYAAGDFGIYIGFFTTGRYIEIKSNSFEHKSAECMITVGAKFGSTSSTRNLFLNIEDNSLGTAYSELNGGNGIEICGLGASSSISIIHNNKARFSPYRNTLVIKGKLYGEAVSSGFASNKYESRIDILANQFYAHSRTLIGMPEGRTAVPGGNYSRIGLGVSNTAKVVIESNYFGSSSSKTVYNNLTENTNNQGAYHKLGGTVELTNNAAENSSDANTAYESIKSAYATDTKAIKDAGLYEGSYAPYIIYCMQNGISCTPSGFTAE